MAKSLRSKSKLKAKSIKRGKEFQNAVDARLERLHTKAKEDLIKQKAEELKNKEGEAEDIMADDEMSAEPKKVSTSGYRTARHHLYKKVNKKNKKNHTSFKKK